MIHVQAVRGCSKRSFKAQHMCTSLNRCTNKMFNASGRAAKACSICGVQEKKRCRNKRCSASGKGKGAAPMVYKQRKGAAPMVYKKKKRCSTHGVKEKKGCRTYDVQEKKRCSTHGVPENYAGSKPASEISCLS